MDDPIRTEGAEPEFLASRRRFILVVGVLGWGVPTAILSSLLLQMWKGFPPGWYQTGRFLGGLALALVVFAISGVFFGAVMWGMLARRRNVAASMSRNRSGT